MSEQSFGSENRSRLMSFRGKSRLHADGSIIGTG